MSLTPAEALQAVAKATMTLAGPRVKVSTSTRDGDDGPDLRTSLAQYVIWSVASVLEENYIGGEDADATNALTAQLKTSLGEFDKEVDDGIHPSTITLGKLGGRRTRRTTKRRT